MSDLRNIKILMDTRDTTACPNCDSKDISRKQISIDYDILELKIFYYCTSCGSNFIFKFNIYLSDIIY